MAFRSAVSVVFLLVLSEVTTTVLSAPSFVCYEHLGCFSLNGTFKGVMEVLPETPEQVKTTFKLFTRHNKGGGQLLDYENQDSLNVELFQPHKTTYVIVHGYMDKGEGEPRMEMMSALLDQSDCQVIITDWSRASNSDYWKAAVNTELVGRQIARLIDLLRTRRSLDPSQVHLIGFSLGAHVVGFAGKWTRDELNFPIGRITALDPASLLFEDSGINVHVWKADASFVDAIHTSAGKNLTIGEVGMEIPVGHVDFYPNGGKAQPGCPQFHPACSHLRVEALFTESVRNLGNCFFASVPCPEGYDAFQMGLCIDCGAQGCGRMGLPSKSADGRGIQFLDTNDQSPFCKLGG